MKTSPLQLDDAFVVEVSIKESSRYAGVAINPADVRVTAEPHFQQAMDNPRKWEVDLLVTFSGSNEKPLPYHGRLISRGFFTISESLKRVANARSCCELPRHIVLYGAGGSGHDYGPMQIRQNASSINDLH